MSISQEQTVSSQRSVQECAEAVRQTMADLGMNPRVYGDRTVVGNKGSAGKLYLMMIAFGLSALLAPSSVYPVRIQVEVEDQGAERRLHIAAEEAYLAPIMAFRKKRSALITAEEAYYQRAGWGMKGKMRKAAEGAVQQVAQGSLQRLGAGAPIA